MHPRPFTVVCATGSPGVSCPPLCAVCPHLALTWPAPDPHLALTSPSPDPHLALTSPSPGPHLTTTSPSPRPHLTPTSPSPHPHLTLTSLSPRPHLAPTSPSTRPQLQCAPPQQVLSVNSRTSQADLEHLLTHSHVVSLHCPLSPSTEGMLGAAELALMRPDAVLINTARGQVGGPHAGWVLQPLRQSTGHMAQWGSWGGMPCPGRCPGRACLVLVGHALSW